MSRYFRLMDDVYIPEPWHLADPLDEQGWSVVLIVSERVKRAIESTGLVGPQFEEIPVVGGLGAR